MHIYLLDYSKNRYRVRPKLDVMTNDFPRDINGDIDETFQDFYIKCRNGFEIQYHDDGILEIYNDNPTKGRNIMRQVYTDQISPDVPKRYGNLINKLVSKEIIVSAYDTPQDFVCFFPSSFLDYFAGILDAETRGASISPLSNKNLPKTSYSLPDQDQKKYDQILSAINLSPLDKALLVKKINEAYKTDKIKNNPSFADGFKKAKLPLKEYIHQTGLWSEYLTYLKGAIK